MNTWSCGYTMSYATHVGMVNIPPINMVMTGGWCMAWFYPQFIPWAQKKSWHSTWIYLVQGCSSTNLDDRKEHDLLASSWHVLIHIPTTNWTTSSKWMLKSWIWWLGDLSSWLDDWNLYVSDDMNSLDDAILTRFGWFSKHTVIRCAPNSGCHTSPSIL